MPPRSAEMEALSGGGSSGMCDIGERTSSHTCPLPELEDAPRTRSGGPTLVTRPSVHVVCDATPTFAA